MLQHITRLQVESDLPVAGAHLIVVIVEGSVWIYSSL